MRISHWVFLKYGAILTSLLALPISVLTLDEAAAETSKKEASGSLARGQAIFTDTCSHCHSAKPIPFKTSL